MTVEDTPAATGPVQGGSPRQRMKILQCATETFLRRGYAGTTIEEVAQAAGVGKIAIYQNFGDKVELFAQCMTDAAGTYAGPSLDILRLDCPMHDVLVAFAEQHIRRMVRPVFATHPFYEFVRVLLSASITHPDIAARCMDVLQSADSKALEAYFQQRIALGELTMKDPHFLARHFMQTIFFTNFVLLTPDGADEYRDVHACAERSVALFLNGCCAASNNA